MRNTQAAFLFSIKCQDHRFTPGSTESTTMRKMIALTFLLSLASLSGSALAATPEEQAACQDDAFKFCNEQIPDEQKVKACLIHNLRKLTPACRKMFARSRRK
jgi:hypothetical protein